MSSGAVAGRVVCTLISKGDKLGFRMSPFVGPFLPERFDVCIVCRSESQGLHSMTHHRQTGQMT